MSVGQGILHGVAQRLHVVSGALRVDDQQGANPNGALYARGALSHKRRHASVAVRVFASGEATRFTAPLNAPEPANDAVRSHLSRSHMGMRRYRGSVAHEARVGREAIEVAPALQFPRSSIVSSASIRYWS